MVSLISISTSESKAIVFSGTSQPLHIHISSFHIKILDYFLIPHSTSFLIPHSSFLIPHSIPHAPFLTLYSSYPIPHSSYPILFFMPVPNSIILIPHSSFYIPHSSYRISYSLFFSVSIQYLKTWIRYRCLSETNLTKLPINEVLVKKPLKRDSLKKGHLCKGHLILPHTNTSVYQNYLRIRDTSEYRTLSMYPSCPIFTGSTVY